MAETKLKNQAFDTTMAGQYGSVALPTNAGALTIASATPDEIDATNFKVALTIKRGNLICCVLELEGTYHSQVGYDISFNVCMDSLATTSNSGARSIVYQDATDGSVKASKTQMYYFTGVTPGAHTFYPTWCRTGGTGTSYIAQYAQVHFSVFELGI